MTQRVCIVGGGATGVTLLWALAKAKQQGFAGWDYDVTVLHEPTPGLSGLGGHSATYPVEVNGNTYEIDLGVQMVAPAMYPNMMCMLALPELASVKLAPVDLKISCAFPPSGGVTPYWGNFPAYQSTDLYEQHAADCAMFGQLLTDEPILLAPLANYLAANGSQFADLTSFESFFLDPYMSIMNGYGQALLGDVLVPEIALLFNEGFASFVDSGTGFQRFVGGAITFVDALAQFAQVQLGSALHLVTPAQATAITPVAGGGATVSWTESGQPRSDTFDIVVVAVDLQTAGALLDNEPNSLWSSYAGCLAAGTWPLEPGYCYLHTDTSVIAPGMPDPLQETLQFTASYATGVSPYDLSATYTTYIERNLLQVPEPDADDFPYLLTMYGYDPTNYAGPPPAPPVPDPAKTLWSSNWIHGMWLPSFMWGQKLAFHAVQGTSPHYAPYRSQPDTSVYFAGNNLTMDSQEGAIGSALVLAEYAFGIPAQQYATASSPSAGLVLRASAFFELFWNMMFPGLVPGGPAKLLSVLDVLGTADHR